MTGGQPKPSLASVTLFLVAAFLLVSMGGAILAAPVTLPWMFLAVRHRPSMAFRAAPATIGGLTTAEVVWAATYLVVTEAKPWIWLLPLIGAVLAAYVYVVVAPLQGRRDIPSSTTTAA